MWLFLFQHLHATPPGQAEVLEVLDLLKHCSRVLNKVFHFCLCVSLPLCLCLRAFIPLLLLLHDSLYEIFVIIFIIIIIIIIIIFIVIIIIIL